MVLPKDKIKMFVATKAFVVNKQGKVLILKESSRYKDGTNKGLYDVVGGRVEPGERFDKSLLREIKEETGLDVEMGRPFFVNEWRPEAGGEKWHIVGTFFECLADDDNVVLSDDHDDFKWIVPAEYKNHDLIENLFPAFESYLSRSMQP